MFVSRFLGIAAAAIACLSIWGAAMQPSALVLREQRPALYWPRYNTQLSGIYDRRSRRWQPSAVRTAFGGFRGGGPGAGK